MAVGNAWQRKEVGYTGERRYNSLKEASEEGGGWKCNWEHWGMTAKGEVGFHCGHTGGCGYKAVWRQKRKKKSLRNFQFDVPLESLYRHHLISEASLYHLLKISICPFPAPSLFFSMTTSLSDILCCSKLAHLFTVCHLPIECKIYKFRDLHLLYLLL